MKFTLELKNTRKYRLGWDYLDEWVTLGGYEVILTKLKRNDENDTFSELTLVKVDSTYPTRDVIQALKDTCASSKCQHDYDCCGCITSYAESVEELGKDYYLIKKNSYRNY